MKLDQKAAPSEHIYDLLQPRAVDGDTIECWVDLGLNVCTKIRIRLKGFFAPELTGDLPDQGTAATVLLQKCLDKSRCQVKRRGMRQDQNGRWLSTLLLDGKPADPFLTIFPYQLTEEQHALDLRAAKRNRQNQPNRPKPIAQEIGGDL